MHIECAFDVQCGQALIYMTILQLTALMFNLLIYMTILQLTALMFNFLIYLTILQLTALMFNLLIYLTILQLTALMFNLVIYLTILQLTALMFNFLIVERKRAHPCLLNLPNFCYYIYLFICLYIYTCILYFRPYIVHVPVNAQCANVRPAG